MSVFICFHLDGELAKPSDSAAPSENTSTTTTTTITSTPPPFPNPAVTSPAGDHAPRLKRPTFLPIKNHARPALTSYDKQSPVGSGKGLEERSHASLPLGRSTTQGTPPCSSLGSLPNSMYQLPAGARLPTSCLPTSSLVCYLHDYTCTSCYLYCAPAFGSDSPSLMAHPMPFLLDGFVALLIREHRRLAHPGGLAGAHGSPVSFWLLMMSQGVRRVSL